MSPPKKKKMKKGGSQPVSKSKQDDGGQSVTLGENDEQSRVLSSSPERIGLNTTTENHGSLRKRSFGCFHAALTETSEFYMENLCYHAGASYIEYDYDISLMGYIHWEEVVFNFSLFDDRCLLSALTCSQKAEALSYAIDALDVALENPYQDEDYLYKLHDEIYSRWPMEDTSIYTIRRTLDLGEYYMALKTVVSDCKRRVAKRRNVYTATMMGSDTSGKGQITSSNKITGVHEEEKALDGMLGLTEFTSEPSESGEYPNMDTLIEGVMSIIEECAPLTPDRTSDLANIDLQGYVSFGSYISSEQTPTHDVLEALYDKVESSLSDNYYDKYRALAQQHWDKVNYFKDQAATAKANGNKEEEKYCLDQEKMWRKMAKQADERASQDIFDSRNKDYIVNLITIDLHGQHKQEGMEIFRFYLEFGVYGCCLRQLRVITGYGSHGTGPSVLKESVTELLQNENIEWEMEIIGGTNEGIEWTKVNPGVLLIKFDGEKRELDYVKYGSYSN